MANLRTALFERLTGRVCLLGIGNVNQGDDGLGVKLAQDLQSEGAQRLFIGAPVSNRLGARDNPKSRLEAGATDPLGAPASVPACSSIAPLAGWKPSLPDRPEAGAPEQLQADGQTQVVLAETAPERYLGQVAQGGFDQVVFLDAVEFGGAPGSVVFLDAAEMTSRFPQISTHKLSLGVLAQLVEAGGKTRAWLLGVQPASLKAGEGLTSPVQATLDLLRELLKEVMFFRLAHSNAAPAGVL